MSDESRNDEKAGFTASSEPARDAGTPAGVWRSPLLRLPGLAAIALYMLLLAGVVILDVATGHFPGIYVVFPALFIAAGFGLLMLFRWAWALTLGAVVLLVGLFLYQFSIQRAPSALVQGLLNLVFFLYLVRTDVRSKLR